MILIIPYCYNKVSIIFKGAITWSETVTRYDSIELLDFALNFVKDLDFKALIEKGLEKSTLGQLKELEKAISHYRVPFPPRPPKSQNLPSNMESFRDEFLYKLILDITQAVLTLHLFMNFLTQDLNVYDELVKYGKVKGWLENAPIYKTV